MSSWDRQETVSHYAAVLDEAADTDAMIEELGTPTKLAIELARTYQPSAAPERAEEPELAAETETETEPEPEQELPGQLCLDLEPEQELPEPQPRKERRVSKGALAAYLIPAILIGLPITVAALCLGLPILAAGAALVVEAVKAALAVIAALSLVSDILLMLGGALILCALGLLLCWLGIWISVELGYLWVDRVVFGLGRKLCVKEVAAE